MPIERQQRAPVQRRDRLMLASLAVAGAVIAAVAAWVYVGRNGSKSGRRCVNVTLASTMGGATVHRCGADAARFCRSESRRSADVAAACRRAGLPVR